MREIGKRLSVLENFLSMLLAGKGISDNVFVGPELPAVLGKDWDTMVLVDVTQRTNRNAYTTGSANIYLYARPTDTTLRKPVHVLDAMEEALDNAIAGSRDAHFATSVEWRDSDYDPTRNLYFNIVNVDVVAK